MSVSLPLFDRTESRFREYHEQNPAVYEMFCRFAKQLLSAGRTHIGAKMIAERLRWESHVTGNDGFKINNSFIAYYARMFERDNPLYGKVFERRRSQADAEV